MKLEEYKEISERLKIGYDAAMVEYKRWEDKSTPAYHALMEQEKHLAVARAWQTAREVVLDVAEKYEAAPNEKLTDCEPEAPRRNSKTNL